MNKSQLYIPEKCKVGFQKREGTYCGILGYIIYNDGKVWRKETSWEGWRHKEGGLWDFFDENGRYQRDIPITGVEPIEFENVPTEGFVLNKKAGGTSSGWNQRQTYCRVYDPRGWEFEISIQNLLFILEECSSFKGKGLEGEFVYSWDGKDLVLLSVSSYDYKLCKEYTDLQSKKIGKRDLVEGCTYLTSKQERLTYLGRFSVCVDIYNNQTELEIEYYNNKHKGRSEKMPPSQLLPTNVFKNENTGGFEFLNSYSRLKEKVSDDIHPDFADIIDEFQKSVYFSLASHLTVEEMNNEDIKKINQNYGHQLFPLIKINTVKDISKNVLYYERRNDNTFIIYRHLDEDDWWRNKNRYIIENGITLDQIAEKYGILTRVYENGFKTEISV